MNIILLPVFHWSHGLYRYVIANDLSPSAVEVIKRNVKINDLVEEGGAIPEVTSETSSPTSSVRVRVHQGDAW